MAPTDEQLIELCKEEDVSALDELLKRYRNPLMGFIYSVIRDYHQAQDISRRHLFGFIERPAGFGPEQFSRPGFILSP